MYVFSVDWYVEIKWAAAWNATTIYTPDIQINYAIAAIKSTNIKLTENVHVYTVSMAVLLFYRFSSRSIRHSAIDWHRAKFKFMHSVRFFLSFFLSKNCGI